MRPQDILLFGGMVVSWQLHLVMLMSPPPQASTFDSRTFDLLFVESAEETSRLGGGTVPLLFEAHGSEG